MTDEEVAFRIAEIGVRLRLGEPRSPLQLAIPETYGVFRCSNTGPHDVEVRARVAPPPPIQGRHVFTSGTLWQLYEHKRLCQIAFFVPRKAALLPPGGAGRVRALRANREKMVMDRLAIFRSDFTKGELYLSPDVFATKRPKAAGIFPLSYPLDELLFINLLAQGRGVELHGCGVSMRGEGLLFIGPSGAGKSTIARLMATRPGVTVLSDDRTILRRMKGRWRIYGTPWHGTARAFAAEGAELKRIFVLRHSDSNQARRLSPARAAAILVARSFPTYWNRAGMNYTLTLVEQVISDLPIYDLGFQPTISCVDFVQSIG